MKNHKLRNKNSRIRKRHNSQVIDYEQLSKSIVSAGLEIKKEEQIQEEQEFRKRQEKFYEKYNLFQYKGADKFLLGMDLMRSYIKQLWLIVFRNKKITREYKSINATFKTLGSMIISLYSLAMYFFAFSLGVSFVLVSINLGFSLYYLITTIVSVVGLIVLGAIFTMVKREFNLLKDKQDMFNIFNALVAFTALVVAIICH